MGLWDREILKLKAEGGIQDLCGHSERTKSSGDVLDTARSMWAIRPQTRGESRAQSKKFNHFWHRVWGRLECDGNKLGEHPDFISEAVIKSNPDKNTERVYFRPQFQAIVHLHLGKPVPELEPTNAQSGAEREWPICLHARLDFFTRPTKGCHPHSDPPHQPTKGCHSHSDPPHLTQLRKKTHSHRPIWSG